MKRRFVKNTRGGVTVFLIIIMLPSFMFGGYIFDVARIDAAKNIISSSGDLSLNAMLSEYSEDLYSYYGLLATAKDPVEMQSQIEMMFDNMLQSSSLIQSSDSTTVNIIHGMKDFMNNPDSTNFDNLIKLSSINNLTIGGVENSQITNPDTLKNQIVEYMKYRGPISMVSGLLTKLKTIGDVDKQAEAINKKVAYEDKLSDIGNMCKNAYNAINTYNDSVGNVDSAINVINSINGQMDYICEILSYQHASDNTLKKYPKKDLTVTDQEKLNQYSQEELYAYISNYFDNTAYYNDTSILQLKDKGESLKNVKSKLQAAYQEKQSNLDSFPKSIYEATKELNKYKKEYVKLYWYCDQYCKNYVNKGGDENTYNSVKTFKNNFAGTYQTASGTGKSIIYVYLNDKEINNYYSKANEKLTIIKESVKGASDIINDVQEKLNDAYKKLDNLTSKIEKAEDARKSYGTAINSLADSEYKASLKSEYVSSARNLDTNNLKILKNKISDYTTYLSNIKKAISNGGTFYEKNLNSKINSKDLTIGENDSKTTIKSNYKDYSLNNISGSKAIRIDESDKFYSYLKTICKDLQSNDQKNSDKNKISNILENSTTTPDVNVGNNSSISGTSGYIGNTEGSLDSESFKGGEFDEDNIASKFTTYFSSMGNLLKSITNIKNIFNVEDNRDALYLSEYMTEMFSYNTIEKEDENAVSLAGKPFDKNPFYLSEIEYILCGKDTAQANIDAVQAKLFVTRFIFNLMYAMTDSEINAIARTTATAICSAMPFLIPLVKTVIVCSFALAESSIDLKLLMDGKEVAFIKNQTTFLFRPNNFTDLALTTVKNQANKGMDSAISQVTNWVINGASEGITNIEKKVTEYIENVEINIQNSIMGIFNNAIFERCYQIIGDYDQYVDSSIEDLSSQLDSVFEIIKNEDTGNEITNSVKNTIINEINKGAIVSKLKEQLNNLNNGSENMLDALKKIETDIEKTINDSGDKILGLVESKLENTSNELKISINDVVNKYSDELKSEASEEINRAFDKFNSSVSTNQASDNKSNSLAGAGFALSYKEYLKLFVILQNMDNNDNNSQRDAMLKRTANLIGINIKNNDTAIELSNMYTIVSISGDVDVGTLFLNIPIVENTSGNKDFDFNNLAKRKRNIKYNSVRGY